MARELEALELSLGRAAKAAAAAARAAATAGEGSGAAEAAQQAAQQHMELAKVGIRCAFMSLGDWHHMHAAAVPVHLIVQSNSCKLHCCLPSPASLHPAALPPMQRLVDRAQTQARFSGELERLQMARDLVWGRQLNEWQIREARRGQGRRARGRGCAAAAGR